MVKTSGRALTAPRIRPVGARLRSVRPLPFLAGNVALAAVLSATPAAADGRAACLDAASRGQSLRDAHELVEARDALRACAAASCPGVVQADCAGWLADVERVLPAVIVTAKDGSGVDLVDVTVTVDGQPFATKLAGEAVPMDPGSHAFHFEAAAGSVDKQVVVVEGDKSQRVSVVLGSPRAEMPTPGPGPLPSGPRPAGARRPWNTAGWILGGAGVVGLGVGVASGVLTLVNKGSAHCDGSGACDPGASSGVKSTALVADIGFIAGGVLLASGAALLLFGPTVGQEPTARVRVAPALTAHGGVFMAEGNF